MRRKVRKYFQKVKKGKMSAETAAKELECSLDQFEKEYEKYYNPFTPNEKHRAASVILIMSLMLSIGTYLAAWDANRIQIQPDLKIEDGLISLYWDGNGKLIYADSEMLKDTVPQDEFLSTEPQIIVRNLGKGSAKDIVYNWKFEDNLFDLSLKLNTVDCDIVTEIDDNNILTVEGYDEQSERKYQIFNGTSSFISPETETAVTLPRVYMDLISLYCDNFFPASDQGINYDMFYEDEEYGFIEIRLNIEYDDVSSGGNTDRIRLKLNPVYYHIFDNDVSGCTFQLKTYAF